MEKVRIREDHAFEVANDDVGLQCHTAPYSWKILFEFDNRLYELLLSASCPADEQAWKECLKQPLDNNTQQEVIEIHRNLQSELLHEIKPVVNVYGQGQPIARRLSIKRAATLASRSQMCQVVIRNTASPDYAPSSLSSSSLHIGRSQSHMTPSHIQVLCPRRSERIQLETAMTDLYTKDALPFPGMKGSDNPFRASAHSVMRKLSMVSIASSFSRRSASLASLHGSRPRQPSTHGQEAFEKPSRHRLPPKSRPAEAGKIAIISTIASAPPSKPAVDFHKTPEAFLPPDFSLRDPRMQSLPRNSAALRAVASKQVLADRPHLPEYKRLKKSMSMQVPELSFDEDRPVLAERPSLLSARSEVTRRKSLDGARVLDSLSYSPGRQGKENGLADSRAGVGITIPSKPLSRRLRNLIR
jgi:hypothetical protein